MSRTVTMGGTEDDRIYLGCDYLFDFEILDIDTDPTGATAKDMTGKTPTWDVRPVDDTTEVLLTVTASIVGVFNAVASTNTQRVRVAVTDDDLDPAVLGADGGEFRYSLKDTTTGAETILAEGDIIIERATQV